MFCDQAQIEYFQKDEIASESQGKTANDIKTTSPEDKTQNILFDSPNIEQSNTPSISVNPYENLIVEEYLPGPNQTAYHCREHPDKWYIDLEGLELNHFKLLHTKKEE
jgi:hypothetical protein